MEIIIFREVNDDTIGCLGHSRRLNLYNIFCPYRIVSLYKEVELVYAEGMKTNLLLLVLDGIVDPWKFCFFK